MGRHLNIIVKGTMTRSGVAGVMLGCVGPVVAIGLAIGGLAFQYSLWSIFGKDVPWYADAIASVIVAPIVIPLAILCWIARLCGVQIPFYS